MCSSIEVEDAVGELIEQTDLMGFPKYRATLANTWTYGDFSVDFNTNFIGQER